MENKNIETVEPKFGGIKGTILSRRNKKYSLMGTIFWKMDWRHIKFGPSGTKSYQ
jgi:hypothetical protein